MSKKSCIIFIFFLCCFSGFAQHAENIEKLRKKLTENIPDSTRLKVFYKLSDEISYQGNPKEALEWTQRCFDLAKKINYEKIMWDVYNQFGNVHISLSDYPKAIE